MVNYYSYLWKMTWLEVVATGFVTVFILGRLVWKIVRDFKRYKRWGRLVLLFRVGFWLGILGIYLLMFSLAEPDWLARPGELQGEVQGKSLTDSTLYPYSVELKAGAGPQSVWVDYRTFKTVNPGDRVKIEYLPNRLEVYRCEVLP